ncbi:MAG: hypothetical protein J5645_05875 [Lachnospiraceae bacterium]|nr:hypothetical protein [Lachnospiraceae bacterium]
MRYDRVVFVCRDNSCLSMIAENVFIHRYEGEPLNVASRGIVVLFEVPCNPKAEEVLTRHGVEMVRKTCLEIRSGDITDSTLVIVLKESDRQKFLARFPYAQAFTLAWLAGEDTDVHDPYGGAEADYEQCYEDIDRMIGKAIPAIRDLIEDKRDLNSSELFEKEIMEEERKDDSFRM